MLASNCAALQTEVSIKRRGHFVLLLMSHHRPNVSPLAIDIQFGEKQRAPGVQCNAIWRNYSFFGDGPFLNVTRLFTL